MMDWSDRHCRYFWRQLTKEALLYTEMVTTGALIHGDRGRFLTFHEEEHPVALQLGGSCPSELGQCAQYAEEWGYNEVNLNVGCPSDRVQNNRIGACLMAHPQLVADCLKAMQDQCDIPVTVKHRIGIDDQDSYEHMRDFVGTVAQSGCDVFIVHARKAILSGLSPKENREIPPLHYDYVYRLKREFPQLEIIINGGIKDHEQAKGMLKHVDGVMVGREAYHNPGILMDVDRQYFSLTHQQEGESREDADLPTASIETSLEAKKAAVRSLYPYIEEQLCKGALLHHISRHTLGLFNAMPGGRLYRRYLSENAHKKSAGPETLEQALERVKSPRIA